MSSRRRLSEMLAEIVEGLLDVVTGPVSIRVRELAVALPIELRVEQREGQIQLLGDLPRTVTRTAFDSEPGRLHVVCRDEVA